MKILTKRINKHVENTKEQILNTLLTMSELGLTRITKDIYELDDGRMATLTWDNHVPGRHNAGNAFTTLNQYVSIYETGAYHCVLFDGSIIRVYFKFNKNILVQESMLYWPAPIIIPEDDVDELGIREAINLYLSSTDSNSKELLMRSPIRFDFDSTNIKPQHPATHVHLQHAECRISAKKPVCFNTFIKFIFFNFYPQIELEVLKELDILNYSGYEILDKAVISI